MAESYASFQGKEPNIDVNLFVNALTAGIAAGNAQDSSATALFKGIDTGVKNAVSTAQGVQGIRANENALAVSGDPNVIQAKKDSIIADAQSGQAQAQIAQRTNETQALTKATDQATAVVASQVKNEQASIAAQDTAALRDLVHIGTVGDTAQGIGALQDPAIQQALTRNPLFGQQFVTALRQRGGDPAILDPYQKQYENLAYQSQSVRAGNKLNLLAAKEALKNEGLAGKFQNTINTTPEFESYNPGKAGYDYRNFNITESPNHKVNTPTTYDYRYGDQVIKSRAIVGTPDFTKHQEALEAWKASHYAEARNPPPGYGKPDKAAQQESTVNGLHNLKPEEVVETPQPTGKARAPYLEEAVKIGGFSPTMVDNNAKSFKDLSATILSVADSGDTTSPASFSILQESVKHTANGLSDYIYNNNPTVQSRITRDQMDQHNEQIKKSLGSNVSPEFAQQFLVKTPQELYFATNGAPLIGQVDKYSKKILQMRIQATQLQANKAKSNSGNFSILKELSSGK